jgi:hypothetical protein
VTALDASIEDPFRGSNPSEGGVHQAFLSFCVPQPGSRAAGLSIVQRNASFPKKKPFIDANHSCRHRDGRPLTTFDHWPCGWVWKQFLITYEDIILFLADTTTPQQRQTS